MQYSFRSTWSIHKVCATFPHLVVRELRELKTLTTRRHIIFAFPSALWAWKSRLSGWITSRFYIGEVIVFPPPWKKNTNSIPSFSDQYVIGREVWLIRTYYTHKCTVLVNNMWDIFFAAVYEAFMGRQAPSLPSNSVATETQLESR